MPLTLVTIPCLTDNYAYLLHDEASGETALVDAPEAAPIQSELDRRGWALDHIFLTHHHSDHIDGVAALRGGARVYGAAADAHRLPPLDVELAEGDTVTVGGESGHALDVSGHTMGHIAFHFPESGIVFTADSLMALGCGRLFEGDAETMWASLSKLAALPPETVVCSGHEYTAANARFALTVDPDNDRLRARSAAVQKAREDGRPTVPSELAEELATNPFLRAADTGIRRRLGMESAPDAAVFAEIRRRKDQF